LNGLTRDVYRNSTCSLTSFGLRSNETSNFYSTGCIMYPYL
jgi:hypothetical protein